MSCATFLGLTIGLFLVGCTSVDIGGPKAARGNPAAGILNAGGREFAVLPGQLNYTGAGSYTWPDGRVQTGIWREGLLQGIGTETTSGDTYTGQWQDGQRSGHGELSTTQGRRYVGDFAAGLPQGKGTETASGGVYRGSWQAGHRHGQGQFNGSDGAQYQGQWRDNQRAGYGQQKYADGDVYEGDWLHDERHGFGTFYYADAATYEGSWERGKRQGYGSWTSPSQVRYEGTWLADQRHGFGKESSPDGTVFAGEWRAGRRHGQGQETHADGSAHRGLWQEGAISGFGRRTNRVGIIISGNWRQNTVIDGSLELPGAVVYQGALFNPDGQAVAGALVNWLTQQASANNAHAQYFLATVYLDFADPTTDANTAQIWLDRAANAGLAEAQFRLSVQLLGDDAQTSVTWLQRAAAQQHPGANEILGEYLHTGQYLEQNLPAAIEHYETAASLGSVTATNNLAWLLATARDPEIADPDRAIELIRPFVLYLGNWQHLDTLAAAHARLGDTALAERMQSQALISAQAEASGEVISQMTARLELYIKDRAYTE